tara:strand:- start:21 stop:461 length:441 start_codon:yes stop_codon:yes gene_type:complete
MREVFKNIDLFCPGSNEFLNHFIYTLGYSDIELESPKMEDKIKKEVLITVKHLIELGVLNIKSWYNRPEMSKKEITIDEVMKELDKVWFLGARYPDFYNMVVFGVPKWYDKALKDEGFTINTDWKTFVNLKIGDLEKWIEKNNPIS